MLVKLARPQVQQFGVDQLFLLFARSIQRWSCEKSCGLDITLHDKRNRLTFFGDFCSQLVNLSLGIYASFLVFSIFEALLPLLYISLEHDDLQRGLARGLSR